MLRLECAVRRKGMGEAVEGEGAADDSRACLHISVVSELYYLTVGGKVMENGQASSLHACHT